MTPCSFIGICLLFVGTCCAVFHMMKISITGKNLVDRRTGKVGPGSGLGVELRRNAGGWRGVGG